jgi:hypothetical protein
MGSNAMGMNGLIGNAAGTGYTGPGTATVNPYDSSGGAYWIGRITGRRWRPDAMTTRHRPSRRQTVLIVKVGVGEERVPPQPCRAAQTDGARLVNFSR